MSIYRGEAWLDATQPSRSDQLTRDNVAGSFPTHVQFNERDEILPEELLATAHAARTRDSRVVLATRGVTCSESTLCSARPGSSAPGSRLSNQAAAMRPLVSTSASAPSSKSAECDRLTSTWLGLTCGRKRSPSERDAYAAMSRKAPMMPVFQQRWSVWATGYGGTETNDGDPAVGSNRTTNEENYLLQKFSRVVEGVV